ncbi:MAG: response regulator [Planctomycetes bacterium]|jgi:CheY-like chemotaxis protein|nr:response regulator [Planctomycetota bacterium]
MTQPKALVVDDEFHIVQVVAIKLRNNGFEVFTAENGKQALQLAREHNPDIIITDYQMPVMGGLELIEHLRQDAQTRSTPVVMLTARNFSIDEEQKQRLAIADCLSKPFSPREVLQTIQHALAPHSTVQA